MSLFPSSCQVHARHVHFRAGRPAPARTTTHAFTAPQEVRLDTIYVFTHLVGCVVPRPSTGSRVRARHPHHIHSFHSPPYSDNLEVLRVTFSGP